jgi:hypothetical protein
MAKFNNIGYVAKGTKKDPKKSYVKITADATLKKGDYLSLFEPRQGKEQSDEDFAKILEWKRFDLVQVTDE